MAKYAIGAKKEYEIKKLLESKGFYVIRSAGSHGIFDLVAFNEYEIKFIQSKYGGTGGVISKQEMNKLKKIKVPKVCKCSKELWSRKKGNKEFSIREIYN
jgi:Holliday junction resolvase